MLRLTMPSTKVKMRQGRSGAGNDPSNTITISTGNGTGTSGCHENIVGCLEGGGGFDNHTNHHPTMPTRTTSTIVTRITGGLTRLLRLLPLSHHHYRWVRTLTVIIVLCSIIFVAITMIAYYNKWKVETTTVLYSAMNNKNDNNNNNKLDVVGFDDGTDIAPKCRYDGHCPIGSTCAVPPSTTSVSSTEIGGDNKNLHGELSNPLGVCETIDSPQKSDGTYLAENVKKAKIITDPNYNACTEACYNELRYDEHYFQDKSPTIQWIEPVVISKGRPDGCKIVYKRSKIDVKFQSELDELDKKEKYAHTEHPPAIRKWMSIRFRHIIRTDPYYYDTDHNKQNKKKKDDDIWMVYCLNPCKVDDDCSATNDNARTNSNNNMIEKNENVYQGFVCIEGACQRNGAFWDQNKQKQPESKNSTDFIQPHNGNNYMMDEEMVIVTAATESYIYGLRNLVASIQYWAPKTKVVVYNLGQMSNKTKEEVRTWPNVIGFEWQDGIPDYYPEHISKPMNYAWKPIIMNETLHKYKFIFWLDAGSTLTGPIEPAIDITRKQGIFLVKGQDGDMSMSHPSMYEWFNYSKETFQSGPHYSGNTQAYIYPSRYVDTIVIPNAQCSLDPTCIAPNGSGIENHRYDQTSLSILAYSPRIHAPHYTEFLAAGQEQVQGNLDNPSVRFVWTSRQNTGFYSSKMRKQMG